MQSITCERWYGVEVARAGHRPILIAKVKCTEEDLRAALGPYAHFQPGGLVTVYAPPSNVSQLKQNRG